MQEYLYAIRNKERVQARRNSKKAKPYLYNLSWNMMDGETPSTYFYSSNPAGWNMLDQIMVSKGLLTGSNGQEVVDDSFTIFRPKRIRDGSKPKPFRMKKNNTWVEGFSDHFAVLAKINIL